MLNIKLIFISSKSFVVGLWLMLFSCQLFSGNPIIEKAKTDFKKVNANYITTPTFSMAMNYAVFDNHVNGNLVESKTGIYVKDGLRLYTRLLEIETIVTEKNTIVVNHEDNFLVITDTKKIELSPIQTNIDTLLKICSEVKLIELGKNERIYKLIYSVDDEFSEFSQIDLQINIVDYTIKKITLYYNQSTQMDNINFYAEEKKPRVEITYNPLKKINVQVLK